MGYSVVGFRGFRFVCWVLGRRWKTPQWDEAPVPMGAVFRVPGVGHRVMCLAKGRDCQQG